MTEPIKLRIELDTAEAEKQRKDLDKEEKRQKDKRGREEKREEKKSRVAGLGASIIGSGLASIPLVGGGLAAGAKLFNKFGPEAVGLVQTALESMGIPSEKIMGVLGTAAIQADAIGEMQDRLQAFEATVALGAALTASGDVPSGTDLATSLAVMTRVNEAQREFQRQVRAAFTAQFSNTLAQATRTPSNIQAAEDDGVNGMKKRAMKASNR
jgi:hypothetical protein